MFATLWGVALPISFMSPYIGVLLWVWVAMLSPNELLYGFMSGVPFNKVIAFITILVVAFSREKKDFYWDSILACLLAFVVVATASWMWALVPSADGDQLYQKLLKEVVLAVLIMMTVQSRLRIHYLILTVVITLSFLSAKEGLISILTSGGHKILGTGTIGDNNSVATALLMIVPLQFFLLRQLAVRIVRTGVWIVIGLTIVTVIMTFSRGGFVGLIILSMFMVLHGKKKLLSTALIVVLACIVYGLAPAAWFDRLNTIEHADNDGSFMGRVVAWKISLLIAEDRPLFGGGPHAVQRAPVWSTYTPNLASVDFVTTPPPDTSPHAAHSIYFEVLGDTGFLGLGVFLLLLACAYRKCSMIKRLARGHPTLEWAGDLARMLQVSLVVYAVTGAALSMAYFELVYILVALVSRCHRTARAEVKLAGTTQTKAVRTTNIPVPA